MRNIYLTIIALFVAITSMAATTTVTNSGFTFTPADITINVGDTVVWNIAGAHNVIEVSQTIYNMDMNTPIGGGFSTPFGGGMVTGLTAGTYYYVCSPHAGLSMKGTITVNAAPPGGAEPWINEIHYDNAGGDVDEGFEIAGVAGTDLSCYSVMLYNGSDNELYGNGSDSIVLTGSIDDEGCGFGAVWFVLPANGLQNGSPDGIGLYNHCTSTVVQFLSYEGVIDPAGDGPMMGMTSVDVGVAESGLQVIGGSLQLIGSGTTYADFAWDSTGVNSYNVLNPGQNICGPALSVQTPSFTMNEGDPTTIVTNLIIDPSNTVVSSFEIHLVGGTGSAADLDLTAFGGSFPVTVPVPAGSDTLTVPITPIDDAVFEGTETFDFVIRNTTAGLVLGLDSTFVLTLTDNELPPDTTVTVTTTAITANEGDGTADITLEISQLSAFGSDFTVDVALTSGTAADLDSYTTQTATFTAAGTTTQTVTVNITDDMDIEGVETFTFTLENASSGLMIGAADSAVLTINDNDAAILTLAAISAVDAAGVATLTGTDVIVYGVVNSPDRGFSSIEFSIEDATGGTTVYSEDMALTYEAMVGDSVEVNGKVGARFGVTVITDITSITLISAGSAIDTLTALHSETVESQLIRINNLTLVDATEWTAVGGAGFDVRAVTAANDSVNIRIDRDYDDLYNSAPPIGEFDMVGVSGQFDDMTPFTDFYQIIPRFLTDIITDPLPIVDATIGEINNVNAMGIADSLGRVYKIVGTVNSPDRGFSELEFSMQDATGGITILTNNPSFTGLTPQVGDSYEVVGTLSQDVGVVRLESIQSMTEVSTGNPLDTAVVAAMDDDNESTLIRLNGLSLVDAGQWAAVGGAGFTVQTLNTSGDTVQVRIDRDYDDLYNSNPPSGATFDVVGVSSQFDFTSPFTEGYQIIPRFLTDVIGGSVGIDEILLDEFNLFPNPAVNMINVSFAFDKAEIVRLNLTNAIGQVVSSKEVAVVKGTNNHSFDISTVSNGVYFIEIETSIGTQVSRVVKN